MVSLFFGAPENDRAFATESPDQDAKGHRHQADADHASSCRAEKPRITHFRKKDDHTGSNLSRENSEEAGTECWGCLRRQIKPGTTCQRSLREALCHFPAFLLSAEYPQEYRSGIRGEQTRDAVKFAYEMRTECCGVIKNHGAQLGLKRCLRMTSLFAMKCRRQNQRRNELAVPQQVFYAAVIIP